MNNMKKVIITGASGFIGSALSKRLLKSGVKVYGVGRNINKLNELKTFGDFVPVVANFADYDRLDELIDDRDFDMFWHFAWDGASTFTPNFKNNDTQIGNIKVAVAAATSAAKLRSSGSSSSSSSYQHYDVIIENNEYSLNPVIYGIAKKSALDLFKAISYQNKMACNNVIFPNVYGVGDSLNTAIMFFINKLLANEPLSLISGTYLDDWIYIDDLVDGILCAAKSTKNYTDYYIGHRNITTFAEKLTTMKQILSSQSELNFGTYPENYKVDYTKFDLNALHNDTGFVAKTEFADSIVKTADWLRSIKG